MLFETILFYFWQSPFLLSAASFSQNIESGFGSVAPSNVPLHHIITWQSPAK